MHRRFLVAAFEGGEVLPQAGVAEIDCSITFLSAASETWPVVREGAEHQGLVIGRPKISVAMRTASQGDRADAVGDGHLGERARGRLNIVRRA